MGQVSDSFTRQADMLWRYVNPNSVGAMFGELKQVAASTTPNFKDAFARVIAKFRYLIQPRVARVSCGFFLIQRCFIPMPLCECTGSRHRDEVMVAGISHDLLFLHNKVYSRRPGMIALREISRALRDFVNNVNEHFGTYVVALGLRNVIAFESNSRPHERLRCFAVQASIAPKQHIFERTHPVSPV